LDRFEQQTNILQFSSHLNRENLLGDEDRTARIEKCKARNVKLLDLKSKRQIGPDLLPS
jgi:hypothetical protein